MDDVEVQAELRDIVAEGLLTAGVRGLSGATVNAAADYIGREYKADVAQHVLLEPGLEVRVVGTKPDSGEEDEAVVRVLHVPRVGEQLSVWTGSSEEHLPVTHVLHPSWGYAFGPDDGRRLEVPVVVIDRTPGMSDEDWADVFTAMRDRRHP